jgi:formate dehydrogenase subunit beta
VKGAQIPADKGIAEGILSFLKKGLQEGIFDALLLPVRVPAGDSFSYVLMQETDLLSKASPLPPVMSVQGARAISNLTRYGEATGTIAVLMRPCEIRATVELHKLEQVNLENVFLFSVDCPGVLPLKEYLKDPRNGDAEYSKALGEWIVESPRWACQVCDTISPQSTDLHIGIMGAPRGKLLLIPRTDRGKRLLKQYGLKVESSITGWQREMKKLTRKREKNKEQALQLLRREVRGPERLLKIFSNCINCHNCMRVCPVCYCRQCYFDSEALKMTPDNFMMRAQRKGGLRFMPDMLLFQLGRMSHMSLSCVSCGMCEDACPMEIPVSRIFTLVANDAQAVFGYLAGRSLQDRLPQVVYQEEELKEVETPYQETYRLSSKAGG